MKVGKLKCKLKHQISTMVICESYRFELSVSKDMREKKSNDKRKIPAYLLTLIVKESRISVEQGRVVTTLNIIKH